MAYRIFFTAEAKKDIRRLDAVIRRRLNKKMEQIAELDDIKPWARRLINNEAGGYRLRLGDYRIIFDLNQRNLYILRVRHRREAYR